MWVSSGSHKKTETVNQLVSLMTDNNYIGQVIACSRIYKIAIVLKGILFSADPF